MQIGTRFYRSLYVTLGLACACLGYAEMAFLPEMSVFAAAVGLLLVVAYKAEGRWSLSTPAANVLGAVIAAGAIAWVTYQFFRPWGGTLLDMLPWPTSLLPYLGPLLMILIPAKLFRPKHIGDYWGLQGIGLIAVALGCALGGDLVFALLLLAYLICGMWSLMLFYYYRENQRAGTSGRRLTQPPRSLGQAGVWACFVAGLAMILFLGTPRSGEARWEMTLNSVRLQTGIDEARAGIDLNHNGVVQVSRDLVFEVKAFSDYERTIPKTDLDPNTHWRSRVFNYYENGRWSFRPVQNTGGQGNPFDNILAIPVVGVFRQRLPQPTPSDDPPPSLEPGEFVLEYHPHTRSQNLHVLAEPALAIVREGIRHPAAISHTEDGKILPWSRENTGEWRSPLLTWSSGKHTYLQWLGPPPPSGVGPPVLAGEPAREHLRNTEHVSLVRDWTRALVERLIVAGQLPADVVSQPDPRDPNRVAPRHYEAVARALEAYLARSGAFRYSLTLQRKNEKLDPIEDFVLNTRKGHCNRFATALAMMLRSQGVPTRMVLGYRGFETDGAGVYEIRQCEAHSWVEALIPRIEYGDTVWHWLTLDPTPGGGDDGPADSQWGSWWESTRSGLASFFKNFIVEYDSNQQDRAYSAITGLTWEGFVQTVKAAFFGPGGDDWIRASSIMLVSFGLTVLTWRWLRRRVGARGVADPATAFHRRLLALVARHLDARPSIGQTPREFAAVTAERLRALPAMRAFAGLPADTTGLYYRVRYGGRPLTDTERGTLDGQLDRLAAALAGAPATG